MKRVIPIIHKPRCWWTLWFSDLRRGGGGGFVIYGDHAWPSYSVLTVF